jgi:hypothetical protein
MMMMTPQPKPPADRVTGYSPLGRDELERRAGDLALDDGNDHGEADSDDDHDDHDSDANHAEWRLACR